MTRPDQIPQRVMDVHAQAFIGAMEHDPPEVAERIALAAALDAFMDSRVVNVNVERRGGNDVFDANVCLADVLAAALKETS